MPTMRKAAVAALLLPLVAGAASICVWNYDPLDRFFDPAVGDSIDCSYWVERVLSEQGHSVEVHDSYLPGDITGYDLVFCLMGWYRC
ncbi:MAG: hypothetical protein R6X12_09190 [bacterium]